MIVAVTGATGNIGSAVVELLLTQGHEVRGLARRRPEGTALDERVQWTEVDLASADRDSRLRTALSGAEVVVHTAWGFQPMRDPDYLQRLAIGGTRAVLRAAEVGGVRQLVHLSSAGAYSPGHDVGAVDEDWPTGGVQQLGYSRQKAAVERVLDAHEARPGHGPIIARVRPCLVGRESVGGAVARYVLPSLLPARALSATPVVPLDRGFRLQAVHSHDVATAIWAIIERQASGPFNVAGEQVLGTADVAAALGAQPVHVPWPALRAAVAAAWSAHLQPVEPGWLDLAWHVPVVSTRRAKEVLGWSPEHPAADVLAQAVRGLVDSTGADTPALRPRRWVEQAAHLVRNGPVSRRPMA